MQLANCRGQTHRLPDKSALSKGSHRPPYLISGNASGREALAAQFGGFIHKRGTQTKETEDPSDFREAHFPSFNKAGFRGICRSIFDPSLKLRSGCVTHFGLLRRPSNRGGRGSFFLFWLCEWDSLERSPLRRSLASLCRRSDFIYAVSLLPLTFLGPGIDHSLWFLWFLWFMSRSYLRVLGRRLSIGSLASHPHSLGLTWVAVQSPIQGP
jgi:hypothetical protein